MFTTVRKSFATAGLALSIGLTLVPAAAQSATALEVPSYDVIQEGLTAADALKLAGRAGVGVALDADGSFDFVDTDASIIPSTVVGRGRDENGNATVSQALDQDAIDAIKVISPATAEELAKNVIALPAAYGRKAITGHTELTQADADGEVVSTTNLDTTVSYQLDLGGIPVVGPGAKARVSFGGDGQVTQLNHALRDVAPGDMVKIITPRDALRQCEALYGRGVTQAEPLLAYYAPPLAADGASGHGPVTTLLPHYICQPANDSADPFGGRMVPAVPGSAPKVQIQANGNGKTITGTATITGGTAPYTLSWTSSTVELLDNQELSVTYAMSRPDFPVDEIVTIEVIDANGIAATAQVSLPEGIGRMRGVSVAGGLGGDLRATGAERAVSDMACAGKSAKAFTDKLKTRGYAQRFYNAGLMAWQKNLKKVSANGWDNTRMDSVDAGWYVGHGHPVGITFETAIDSRWLYPTDAQWGDTELEWMQLESCQVLRDTNGKHDYSARWGQVFDGLHLLNGFHDDAACNGKTGGAFADRLFPRTPFLGSHKPAMTVTQAWATGAASQQPAGRRYRTMGPIGANGVTNINDYVWGAGTVGPDIRANQIKGWIAVSGIA